jgi:transposase
MHSDQNASPPRVEVITSVQRRRRWPTAEKIRLVEETMQPGMSVSYVARRADVAPSLLFNWRRRMLEGGLQAVQADEDVVGTSCVRELERRVRELERLLGRKPMTKTIGMVVVAALAASAGGMPPAVAMTETLRPTRSAASAGSRSYCPSAQRYSNATNQPCRPYMLKSLTIFRQSTGVL